ncbi:caspase family protein [Vibrio splendidus]|uniref:caspase family protein n=1 Tax=Vibrio splendidus TaxID=29497 RepID=UPI00148C5329|nr:caspase family protein [Vibrio splendidus]NOI93204.1 caspase family protein [Vibrio splendidus]
MTKRALIIGIDYYSEIGSLSGCVNDAYSVKSVLEWNSDGTKNFDVMTVVSAGSENPITRSELRRLIQKLFEGRAETALLYFAGHGYMESSGGYLCASDTVDGHDGLALSDIMQFSNSSAITNKIIVLDCCHSGIASSITGRTDISELKEGTTILTASTSDQPSQETENGGVFTNLFIDALNGAAANLLGDITPGSVYAHIDQSLSSWEQRPVFKTNVESFVSLRKTHSPVSISDLKSLIEFFPSAGAIYPLDPSFEPERSSDDSALPQPDELNVHKLKTLQKLNRVNLVVPANGAPNMWSAAIQSKGCQLTVLGEHYRTLVEKGHI